MKQDTEHIGHALTVIIFSVHTQASLSVLTITVWE